MNRAPRYMMIGIAMMSAAALASAAIARGGGGGRGGGRIGGAATLCLSGDLLDLSINRIDLFVKPAGNQKAALDELRKAAKDYSDAMSKACAGETPMDMPAKIAASDKRLEAALTGVRKLKPAAEKFYATLRDDQKGDASVFMEWPGL